MNSVLEILDKLIDSIDFYYGKYNFVDVKVKEKKIDEALAKLKLLVPEKKTCDIPDNELAVHFYNQAIDEMLKNFEE